MLVVSDALALLGAGYVATVVRFGQWRHVASAYPYVTFARAAFLIAGLWMVVLWFERLYDLDRVGEGTGEFSRIAKAVLVGTAGFIVLQYVLKLPLPRLWLLSLTVYAGVFVIFGRMVVRMALQAARRRGRLLQRTLIVGENEEAARIVGLLLKDRQAGFVPVGYLGSSEIGTPNSNGGGIRVALLGTIRDIRRVIAEFCIDTVIVASSALPPAAQSRVISDLHGWDGDIQVSAGLAEVTTTRVLVRQVVGVPLITVRGVEFTPFRRFCKRAVDIGVGSLVILLGLPVWLLIAAAVKAGSPGPVFYRQHRVGRGGQPFEIFKFRSMRTDADVVPPTDDRVALSAHILKMKDDPRVTPIGRVLRRYSLDEFPQLINVLRGEMSLVGPRPEQPCEVELYEEDHMRRLDVAPGLTGLWQISGRSDLSVDEKMRLDLYYVENWSVARDFGILFQTLPAMLSGSGAY